MKNQDKKDKTGTNEVKRNLNDLIIPHCIYRRVINHFEECRKSYVEGTEPTCLLLYGDTGVGKTTLIKSFLVDRPEQKSPKWDSL